MKSLTQYISESLEKKIIENLKVIYKSSKNEIYIDCPNTYQEDDIHQYIDDLLLEQMPSNNDIAEKYFRNNVKYINDAYFEYDSFSRLGYKKDDVNIKYDDELGKNVADDIKITTFKITNLKFIMLFNKFEIMIDETYNTTDEILDKIFSAYESNDYNKTDITFKYDSCEYDE